MLSKSSLLVGGEVKVMKSRINLFGLGLICYLLFLYSDDKQMRTYFFHKKSYIIKQKPIIGK